MMMTMRLMVLRGLVLGKLADAYDSADWGVDFITFSEKFTELFLEGLGNLQVAYAREEMANEQGEDDIPWNEWLN